MSRKLFGWPFFHSITLVLIKSLSVTVNLSDNPFDLVCHCPSVTPSDLNSTDLKLLLSILLDPLAYLSSLSISVGFEKVLLSTIIS
jgi:hypothetical protein